MPTYEYECEACGHAFEQFQSITAQPVKKCPNCGKKKVKRLLGTGAGLIFKGQGFYITDYRSDAYNKAATAEKGGGESAASDKSSTNGDAKPAAPSKTETKAQTKPAEPAGKASKSAAKSPAKSKSK